MKNDISNQRNTDPPASCNREKCFPCLSVANSSTPTPTASSKCWAKCSTYNITCIPCKEKGQLTQYWGETGHTSFSRGVSHWTGLQQRSRHSVLHQHGVQVHGGTNHQLRPQDFDMKVIQQHRSNIARQVQEGTAISSQLTLRDRERRMKIGLPRMILNSKTEFNRPGLVTQRACRILY